MILTSSTYRQESYQRPDLQESDSLNRFFARQARIRLEAEVIRDAALATADILSDKMGGRTVFPYQAEGIMDGRADKSQWIADEGESLYRRGIYVHFWRLTPHPFFKVFDAPDGVESCTRRKQSNTPLQALTMLNDPWLRDTTANLAERIVKVDVPNDDA